MKKVLALPIIVTVVLLLILQTALPAQPSEAASRITVPRDYPTIQSAIDEASPGDTIKVLPGTYTEQLTISKSLTLVGSGAKATIIKAPTQLNTNVLGSTYVIQSNNNAVVNMKGFTVDADDSCNAFLGFSILDSSTLNLDSSVITGCYQIGLLVGSVLTPGGPQTGHATITKTNINDYLNQGIATRGPSGTTLTVQQSIIIGAEDSDIDFQIGISSFNGAKIKIHQNKISGNMCNFVSENPTCGPDFLNQVQGFGIFVDSVDAGSRITYNDISSNDVGLLVSGNSGCCKIDHNFLSKDRFFGIVIADGEHTITNTVISNGDVGVLAVAFSIDTVATLDRVLIKGVTTPTQELPVGATAEVVIKKQHGKGLDMELDKLKQYLDSIDDLIGSIF
jgi:hypothetical protein